MPITETKLKEEIKNKLKFVEMTFQWITKKEFTNSFKSLVDFIKKVKTGFEQRFNVLEAKIDIKVSQLKDGADGKDGINGKDGKEGAVGLTGAVGATGESIQGINGADGSPDTPKLIRDKLEFLKKGDRLEIFAIEDLEDRLMKLEERPLGGKGVGGFSYIAMDRHFIENKVLGIGDGSNKDFTLPKAPNPVSSLHVFIGSGSMFLTDDFTLSKQTISFITAPPKKAKVRASLRA